MRLRDRFQQDSFKPNYNSDTISFTNSQWLQQLLLIAMRLNNASNIHENISSPGNTTSTNSSSSMHIGVDNTTTTTTESTTTGCIILELYDKNPTFLYDQDDFHDIDYSVLKMQIIVWTQKHLKPDDLFMDWFETVNRQIYQNKKIHTKKDHLISQDNELSITNVTFCTENLRKLMIGNDQQIFDEFHTYNLNHDIQYVKNETKSDKYGGNEVQILVVITLCSVLIICFLMAVVLRIRSFCKRQSESRKQMRNDRDSAIQINFPYDVNEIQAVEKLPVPSTTFGSNVPPGPVTKRKGICRYNRIPQSSYNSMQSYNRVFNAHTYQPSTVFVINYHDTDHFKESHDQYPTNNEFHRRYLLHSKQSDNLIHASPNQTINLKSTLKPFKNNVEHQNKIIIKSMGRNNCLNKPIQRTNSF
ncbi:unnamed protein product [Schistosoma turkestanicum]|nr:unnamed protein product [Schistosoma turkestanicum]